MSRIAFTLCVIAFTLVSGCKDLRIATGSDDSFIHLPQELTATPVPPAQPLLPTSPNSHWTYRLTNEENGIEEVTVLPSRLIDGQTALVLSGKRKGAPDREELFYVTNNEIAQFSAGAAEKVTLKPPMPILRFPLKFDETLSWQGGVSLRGALVPSRSKSRLRCVEKIKVPAGTFTAYRVDTILETRLTDGLAHFWVTRWFAPGVGVVRTRYLVKAPGQAERVFTKDLLKYKI
ncbi:hypothetical protein [Armatimonas sp.]|uniref:TapB family protein n=1 Tax=Armatimonas sp. TaxID=1872638 RepID=UPI00375203BF